jgi:hypothetical protein
MIYIILNLDFRLKTRMKGARELQGLRCETS